MTPEDSKKKQEDEEEEPADEETEEEELTLDAIKAIVAQEMAPVKTLLTTLVEGLKEAVDEEEEEEDKACDEDEKNKADEGEDEEDKSKEEEEEEEKKKAPTPLEPKGIALAGKPDDSDTKDEGKEPTTKGYSFNPQLE